MEAIACTHVGKIRPNNEDNYLFAGEVNQEHELHQCVRKRTFERGAYHVAGVFDGMGGGEHGERASLIAAEMFRKMLDAIGDNTTEVQIDALVRQGFLDANNCIRDMKEQGAVSGTTGTLLVWHDDRFKIYHIGDSRAYLMRSGELFLLTKDQTLAQMKLDIGLLGNEDVIPEQDRHQLMEYIGRDYTKESIKPVESQWLTFQEGDRMLLCTDGVHGMMDSQEILLVLDEIEDTDMAMKQLMVTSLINGGNDNITCVLLTRN